MALATTGEMSIFLVMLLTGAANVNGSELGAHIQSAHPSTSKPALVFDDKRTSTPTLTVIGDAPCDIGSALHAGYPIVPCKNTMVIPDQNSAHN